MASFDCNILPLPYSVYFARKRKSTLLKGSRFFHVYFSQREIFMCQILDATIQNLETSNDQQLFNKIMIHIFFSITIIITIYIFFIIIEKIIIKKITHGIFISGQTYCRKYAEYSYQITSNKKLFFRMNLKVSSRNFYYVYLFIL